MKAIFTYPNNAGTSYIDPDYIGDDTVGFQKRIKDLVDGTYKTWEGTIPSDTVTNIMSELSKFNDATWLEESSGNNSIYQFWYNPLYTGTVELITEDISSATATHTVTSNIEFSGNHGFYDEQLMTLSGFDGSWSALNGNSYYVKKIDADTIQLCTDSALTLPIEFYDVKNATLSDVDINEGNNVDLNIDTGLHNDLTNGTQVTLSNFDGTMSEHNGEDFYVQNLTSNDFNLSYDAAGNTMLAYPANAVDAPITSLIVRDSGAMRITLTSPSGDNLPFGTAIDPDGNDATTHGPQGQWPSGVWQGPSTMLSVAAVASGTNSKLYLKPNPYNGAPANVYEVYTDPLCTTPLEKDATLGWSPDAPDRQAGTCTVDTPITLARIGDTYTFRMEYTNPIGDLSGNSLYQIISKDYYQFEGMPGAGSSGGFSGFSKRDTGNFYFPYADSALTKPANIGLHILNAYKVLYTTDDTKLFLKQPLDDQGNILTNKDVILDEDTLLSLIGNGGGADRDDVLALLDGVLQSYTFSDQVATGGVNPAGFLNPGYASITGQANGGPEQTLDGNAIMKIGASALPATALEKDWPTTGYTEHVTQIAPSDPNNVAYPDGGAMVATALYNKSTNTSSWSSASGSFFTNLENMYNQNPNNVIGRPFVFGWDYDVSTGSDSGTPAPGYIIQGGVPNYSISPKTAYMLPLGYKTYTDGNGDTQAQFLFQVYGIDTTTEDYGELGTNKSGFRGNNGSNEVSIFGALNHFPDDKVLKTYLEDTFTSSRTPLTNEITITPTQFTNGTADSGSGLFGCTGKLRTGDLVQVKQEEISTGIVTDLGEYIANIYSTFSKDANGDYSSTVRFLPTDGFGGWGNYTDDAQGVQINLQGTTLTHNTYLETRYESILSNTGTMPGGLFTPTTVDNYAYMNEPLVDALYTEGELWSNQIGTTHTQMTTYDITYAYTDSTQGYVQEVYTPPTPNIIPTGQDIDATTGTLTIESNETYRWRLNSVNDHMYGNQTYLQRTGASTYVNNARLKSGSAWPAGYSFQPAIEHFPVTTVGTNVSGYLDGAFTFDTEFPGAFATSDDLAFEIETVPDTYTPPALSPAAAEDVFDTLDGWTDYGYNSVKVWPEHVTPRSAKIVYNSPTIVNNSQNGIKYTRSVGHTNWRLEVTYPAMTAEEFQKFHAVAQAGQGQAMPFFFNLRGENNKSILWRDFWPGGTTALRFKDPVALGDTTALLEGYASNESNAFTQGEVFIDGKNENGRLHTTLNQVDANIYGEAKIRTTWPFREAQQIGWQLYRHPLHAVVTLDSDNFEYSVDTANYYYVSVGFDLDSWK